MRNEALVADLVGTVLRQYGIEAIRGEVTPASRGFSGAEVWKVSCPDGVYALKRWPADQPAYFALPIIHSRMQQARDAGLSFVPAVCLSKAGYSVVAAHGSNWELVTWQPGVPLDVPSRHALHHAVRALAQLHAVWRMDSKSKAVCHAVQLRYQRLTEWSEQDLGRVKTGAAGYPLFLRALHALQSSRDVDVKRLQPWLTRPVPVQTCLGDVWSEHVLFTESVVTGIIDYGGVRMDHPAQDLARLLGSYRLSKQDMMLGLEAYPQATHDLHDLVALLIETGRTVSIGNWLRWMVLENRPFNRPLAEARLARLVEQCEFG